MSKVNDSEIHSFSFLLCRTNRISHRGDGVVLCLKNALSIRIAETAVYDLDTCELMQSRVKCRGAYIELVLCIMALNPQQTIFIL